jgi:hypothetical protein
MTISETIRTTPYLVPDFLSKTERSLRGIGIPE